MAKLATSDAGRKTEVADRYLLIDKLVGESVGALGHGSDEDADALLGTYALYPVTNSHQRSIETQRDFTAVWGQMVGNGVLDDPQELLLGCSRSDGETMEKLDHETSEALEGTRDSDGGRNLDEDALGGVDVDLQLASLVDGRVEQSQETLVKLAQSAC